MAKIDNKKGCFDNALRFFGSGTLCRHSKNKKGCVSKAPKSEDFERCILCGSVTNVPVSMPIDLREDYEIGLGQVCAACAKKQREETEI